MPYQRESVLPLRTAPSAADLLSLVLDELRRIRRQLDVQTLLQLGSSDAILLLGASSQSLPNPASDARLQEIAHAQTGPVLVRVRAVGYQQGGVFVSASSSGAADTAGRAPDTISDGSSKSFYLPKGSRLFARAEKSGGQSAVWVTVATLSDVVVPERGK